MEQTILNDIPLTIDWPRFLEANHVREGSRGEDALRRLAAEAEPIARPKALYVLSFVDEKGDDFVIIDSVRFKSRVLRINLDSTHRVILFTATAGLEMDAWAKSHTDTVESFWAELVNEAACHSAMEYLAKHVVERFGFKGTGRMNPGSLTDWPITEQRALFKALGDTESAIGVSLLPSLLMAPIKSVSGLLFATAEGFLSCQLCPRETCKGRRAPYDAELVASKYGAAAAPA